MDRSEGAKRETYSITDNVKVRAVHDRLFPDYCIAQKAMFDGNKHYWIARVQTGSMLVFDCARCGLEKEVRNAYTDGWGIEDGGLPFNVDGD